MSSLPAQDLDHVLQHTEAMGHHLRGQSVFMTGGTAFVGTWLLESLLWANDKLDLGVDVVVLTRDRAAFCAKAPHLFERPGLRLIEGQAASFEFPAGDFPYVIHAAMEPAFEPDAERPLSAYAANVDGTRRVLEFARTHGARRFLLTSSGAVYGKQPSAMTHIAEDYAGAPSTTDAASVYGQAKRASEFMSTMYGRACGFDIIIARLFAFVGPLLPLDSNFAVGNFIRDALAGTTVRVGGDGTPQRSYLYAADMAIWLWTMLFRGKGAHPYNVGSPQAVTIAELARVVADEVSPEVRVDIAGRSTPSASPLRYVPDTRRSESELGLRVHVPLAEGIRRTAAWHREPGFA